MRDLITTIFAWDVCTNRRNRTSDHVPPRFHPDLVHQLRQCLGRRQSPAGSARARATFIPSLSMGRQRDDVERETKRERRYVCVCVYVTETQTTSNRETDRQRHRTSETAERAREKPSDGHTLKRRDVHCGRETSSPVYGSRTSDVRHARRISLPGSRVLRLLSSETRCSWSANEISGETSSNETRLSARRAHICARPTRAGLYYYRLSPLLSLGPGVEASIPRRRLRATPDPPFPTRAFSQRIGSEPAGATLRRPARTTSFLLARRPRNTRKSSRFLAISRTSPTPFANFLLCSVLLPSLSPIIATLRPFVGSQRARHVLRVAMSVNGAVSSFHAEAGGCPPSTLSIATQLRVAAASHVSTCLLARLLLFFVGPRWKQYRWSFNRYKRRMFSKIFSQIFSKILSKIFSGIWGDSYRIEREKAKKDWSLLRKVESVIGNWSIVRKILRRLRKNTSTKFLVWLEILVSRESTIYS